MVMSERRNPTLPMWLIGVYHTFLLVNAANSIPNIDKKFHFEYLLCSVRKRKRWSKWLKKEENEKIKWIKEYYGVSTKRAEEYFNILSEDQLEQIKSVTTYGEKNK